MAAKATARPKRVKSDLKDVTPGRAGAAFPHDQTTTPLTRKTRWPKKPGARSTRIPRAIPRADPEQRGGRDRAERKGRLRP